MNENDPLITAIDAKLGKLTAADRDNIEKSIKSNAKKRIVINALIQLAVGTAMIVGYNKFKS